MSHTAIALPTPRKQRVVSAEISTTSYEEVALACAAWIEARRRWVREGQVPDAAPPARYVCVTSVHGIVTAVKDSEFRDALNAADVATPDGMPVVWALRSFGVRGQARVYGPDLMMTLCESGSALRHRVFLYGASQETIAALEAELRRRFPLLTIAGVISPPFRPLSAEEDAEHMSRIAQSGAELVFVGLSTPKQERWMNAHRSRLPGVVMVGVGAAFDFHAGRLRQAPVWMRQAGLEWLFRLLMEPARLWRRYLIETPVFLPLWAAQKLGLERFLPGH